MTLKDYYSKIPDAAYPKTEFTNRVAVECGVSVATVRNWFVYGMIPKSKDHIKKISEITGIEEKDMW